jgi:hypothetical protein
MIYCVKVSKVGITRIQTISQEINLFFSNILVALIQYFSRHSSTVIFKIVGKEILEG